MASFLEFNNNMVALNALFDQVSQSYVNDAAVSVTVKDSDGLTLVDSLTMDYVALSDGAYRAIIASTVNLGTDGDIVSVEVTATSGAGSVFYSKDDIVYIKDRTLFGVG